MGMRIRLAAPGDAPVATQVAMAAKAHWGYPPELIARWTTDLTITGDYIARHMVLVAELGDAVVGVCALEEHGVRRELAHLWVLPAAQGLGVGTALLARVREEVAGRPGPMVVSSDPHAAAFYVRQGGRRAGEVAAPIPSDPTRALPVFEFPAHP